MVESEKVDQTAEEAKHGLARDEVLDKPKKIKSFSKHKAEKVAFRYLVNRIFDELSALQRDSSAAASGQETLGAGFEKQETIFEESIEKLFEDFDERLSAVNRRLDRVLEARGG